MRHDRIGKKSSIGQLLDDKRVFRNTFETRFDALKYGFVVSIFAVMSSDS